MNTLKVKILASALIAAVLVVATIFALSLRQTRVEGSVIRGSESNSTTTPGGISSGANLCPNGGGVLNNVIITGPNVGTMQFVNATTSDVNKRTGKLATSTLLLADIPTTSANNSTTTGSLPYDLVAPVGLVVGFSSNVATTTITYKCNNLP